MVYTVALFDSSNPDALGSPVWWRNFIRSNPPGERFNRETTNDRLLEYSASYSLIQREGMRSGVYRYLDFYDEKAYTWFVLRWS